MKYCWSCSRPGVTVAFLIYFGMLLWELWWYLLTSRALPLYRHRWEWSFWCSPVVLVLLSGCLVPRMSLTALRCTASSCFWEMLPIESHAPDAYYSIGLTRCMYAVAVTSAKLVKTFHLMKLKVPFAFGMILSTCLFQLTFKSIVLPRYFMVAVSVWWSLWTLIACGP